MAPRKLSDADKLDVIEIYRQPGETTSTIAKRYGVSTSTISRILKTQLPEDEYRALISQKRSAPSEKPVVAASRSVDKPVSEKPTVKKPTKKSVAEPAVDVSADKPVRRSRKRSRLAEPDNEPDDGQLNLLASEAKEEEEEVRPQSKVAKPILNNKKDDEPVDASFDDEDDELDELTDLDDELDDDIEDVLDDDDDSDLDDEFGDDDEDDDDDLDDLDDLDDGSEPHLIGTAVEIMPISAATFPRTCYLVVDRLSELITHPLKEFSELGAIPAQQESARTLPIFDNHRVARRFSRRNQRVIKVPDGQLITKTSSYLQAKGITHLLIDGNIYSLLG